MTRLSTHVLDTSRGRPLAGVPVTVAAAGDGGETFGEGITDADGRCGGIQVPAGATVEIRFDLAAVWADAFFPTPSVVLAPGDRERVHVPLLVSPFGYSTYLGS